MDCTPRIEATMRDADDYDDRQSVHSDDSDSASSSSTNSGDSFFEKSDSDESSLAHPHRALTKQNHALYPHPHRHSYPHPQAHTCTLRVDLYSDCPPLGSRRRSASAHICSSQQQILDQVKQSRLEHP
ncbi:hypothetical protein BDZ89DRAFT_748417 [Hymenopellis radicata]|nr:hypothetical protein BDZ89DRAFT_748417 [Hymenopellis radicata]